MSGPDLLSFHIALRAAFRGPVSTNVHKRSWNWFCSWLFYVVVTRSLLLMDFRKYLKWPNFHHIYRHSLCFELIMKFLCTFNLHHSIASEYILENLNVMIETIQIKRNLIERRKFMAKYIHNMLISS